MKDEKKERYPSYIPLYYRAYLRARKAVRQPQTRVAEILASFKRPSSVTPDGLGEWTDPAKRSMHNPKNFINKSDLWMDEDFSDPGIQKIVHGLEALKKSLDGRGLRYTNTAATFISRMFYPRSERSKLWENSWIIRHAGVEKGQRVMDVGGASTPFSFYLASLGCDVSVIDNDWGNCGTIYNANYVAQKMGWKLKAYDQDVVMPFPFPDNSFDRVFSICTVEHLTSPARQAMMQETGRILKPGGIAGITMCYDPNHAVLTVDKGLRFGYREKFKRDLIAPSGLNVYGNTDLIDFESESNFLGSLFLIKQ